MLRQRLFSTARQFVKHTGSEDLVDIDVFEKAEAIIQSLKARDCGQAIEWCSLNRSKLAKIKSPLEFRLRLQMFVELVKNYNLMGAIRFARRHFAQFTGY